MRSAIVAVLAACGALVYAAGQAAQAPAQQKPTFQASTNVVVVDATVLDSNGKQVHDLNLEEFSVNVDGGPRRVTSAQFIDRTPRPSPTTGPGALFTSNQTGDTGRLILLVVDQDTIHPGTLRAPAELIDRLFAGFGPSDKVALIALPGPRKLVDLGGSLQQVKDALVRTTGSKATPDRAVIKGTGNPGTTGAFRSLNVAVTEAFRIDQGDAGVLRMVVDRECRTGGAAARPDPVTGEMASIENCQKLVEAESRRIVNDARNETTRFVATMRRILAGLKAVDAPKILIVLSQGLSSPQAPREMQGLDRDAAAARTTIHALQLTRSMFDVENNIFDAQLLDDRDALRAGLEAMVGRAGGMIFEIAGSAAPAFGRLAEEMSGYYLLGVEPAATDRDGKSHNIEVKVGRKGVTVRNRPAFVFEPPAPARAAKGDDSKLVVEAVKSPVVGKEGKEVPIRVATYNMADNEPSMVRVLVCAEIDEHQEKADSAFVGYVVYDDTGKVQFDYFKRSDLERLPSGALRLVTAAAVPAGSYTLRLATARNGRLGSIEHRFKAALVQAGTMKLGDLVLSDGRGTGTQLAPPVDAHMATDRVVAFVQLHGGAPRDASFVLELARTNTAPSLITAPLAPGTVRNAVQTVTGVADVSLLPPGEYRARMVASVGGKPVTTVSAPFLLDAVPRRSRASAPGGGSAPDGAVPIPGASPFNAAEVLAPAVVAPFIDTLAGHSRDLPPNAVELAKAGRFDDALAQLEGRPAEPLTAFVRGAGLLAKANAATTSPERKAALESAATRFRESVSGSSGSMIGAFYIGACYALGGKEQEAANAWQTSLAGLDTYPIVHRMLADALGRLGQAERQVEVLDEAAKQWPGDETFGRRLMAAEFAAGRYEQALAHVESLLAGHPDDEALAFLALQTVYEMALDAPVDRLPALIARLERYRDAYVAAKGTRQALVDEWISYFKRRMPGTDPNSSSNN
ncbi:MAG: VWA domain-containing protein [Bacteroidales bacterium]